MVKNSSSVKLTKRQVNSILSALKKGQTLRAIGERFGISNQKVWRIGNDNGVYSVRSVY